MWKVRNLKELVENAVFVYTETEKTVREATNDEPWGPTGTMLTEIAELSYEYDEFNNLMKGVWERLKDSETVWRRVYKTLLVIDYLIKFGSERVVEDVKENISKISKLGNNTYTDDDKKDQSKNIHHRAKEIINLINDKNRLEHERRNALHASSSAQAHHSAIFSDKATSQPSANTDSSIFDKLKNSKIVSGIKSMLSSEDAVDKSLDEELSPYTYKDTKKDADPITFSSSSPSTEPKKKDADPILFTQASPNTEPKKNIAVNSDVDLFANFENKQKSKINDKNNEFGDFSSSQSKEIKNKDSNDLMDLFSMPSGTSNVPSNQPFSNMFQIPPTESSPNFGHSQMTSMNLGYGAQNSLAQSQNIFNPNPQNATNFNQTTRPTSNSTQASKKVLDVDALMNQNIDNLFSTKNTTNSSFNAPNNMFSSSPQSNSFNQSNAFNAQKPNNQSKYF